MALELVFGSALWGEASWGGFSWGGEETFELPESLVLKGDSWRARREEKTLALAHGSRSYGRELIEARDFMVQGKIQHPGDPDAHLAYMLGLRETLHREGLRFRYRPEFYANVDLADGDQDFEELWGRSISDVRLVLRASDPFWYSSTLTTETFNLSGNDEIAVNTRNPVWPARKEVYPVITVTAPPAASVPSVLLRNDSDEGMQFLYEDLQLKNGSAVVFNTHPHTVERDGQNTLRFFDGAPLRLKPGENVLAYEGAACTLTIQYRTRWL